MKNKNVLLYASYCLIVISLFFLPAEAQIIADHSVVDDYINIPQQYIDSVKKMWVVIAGESHSAGYRRGLNMLKDSNQVYAAVVKESGTPDPYTTANLRASRGTWGDVDNETGWRYGYGEEDWFTSATAISRTKDGIAYCHANNLTVSAIGFGWCWDNGIDANDMDGYLSATEEYINYCESNSIPTAVIYTTGPVDGYSGEDAYNNFLRWEKVREFVRARPSAVLMDYADILCWDDDGTPTTETWNSHTFPNITDRNLQPAGSGHIGLHGNYRLGKAVWWMLARIAGWDGTTTDVKSNETYAQLPKQIILHQNYPNPFNPETVISYKLLVSSKVNLKIFDMLGREIAALVNEQKSAGTHTVEWNGTNSAGRQVGSGTYFCRLTAGNYSSIKKMILLK